MKATHADRTSPTSSPAMPTVDAISKAGLQGLTLFLAQRTALEAGDPIGLDPARDELAFFPLIYWPISPSAPKPSQAGARAASTPT